MLAASRVIASLASMSMSPPVPVVESFKASVPVPDEVSINDESEVPARAMVKSSASPFEVRVKLLATPTASNEREVASHVAAPELTSTAPVVVKSISLDPPTRLMAVLVVALPKVIISPEVSMPR